MYYLQNKPSTSFLCLLEPELWSLKDGARAQKMCFFPIFSRSYLRNHTTYLTKNQHTLFSNHVLQPCQISKQSEGVGGKHLLNWHGMTLCVICVHSYTNILWILYSYTTPSKFGEKSRHLCILDEGIIRHLPRKCFTYGDATLGC